MSVKILMSDVSLVLVFCLFLNESFSIQKGCDQVHYYTMARFITILNIFYQKRDNNLHKP